MHFAFTSEQEALRRSARQFLTEHSSSAQVRKAMASPEGFDREVWQRISQELGWPSLLVPEEYGGAGGTFVDLIAIMEEAGRFQLCAPLLSGVSAVSALLLGGTEQQKKQYLPAIASGQMLATLAWMDPNGRTDNKRVSCISVPVGDECVLQGSRAFIVDGTVADLLIVATDCDGRTDLFVVPAETPGLTRTSTPTMDQTRRLSRITLDGVRLPKKARLKNGAETLQAALQRTNAALAAEQVGGAQRCLDMAVDYAKTRVQFNRPIGSFQAIKHKCADMMVQVESARSAAWYAGWAAAEAPEELPAAASVAKAWCSEAFFQCAAENIQIHGGIGFTWEHDAHLFFKRAQASEALFGSPSYHRELIADEMGL